MDNMLSQLWKLFISSLMTYSYFRHHFVSKKVIYDWLQGLLFILSYITHHLFTVHYGSTWEPSKLHRCVETFQILEFPYSPKLSPNISSTQVWHEEIEVKFLFEITICMFIIFLFYLTIPLGEFSVTSLT